MSGKARNDIIKLSEKPVYLAPLNLAEALKALLKVRPKTKPKKKPRKKTKMSSLIAGLFVVEYLYQNWRLLCKNGSIYISCVKKGVYDT